MRSELLNGGAYSRTAFGSINNTATAAGAGDATEVNGDYANRMDGENGLAMSCKVVITYTASLAAGKTLSFAANLQDATDGAGAGVADYGTALASTVVASATGTNKGTVELDFDLSGAEQFIRAQITPDLSNTATDTCEWSAAYHFFGYQQNPVSDSLV